MAGDFKRITVTAAEEPDEVIVAGVPTAGAAPAVDPAPEPVPAPKSGPASAPDDPTLDDLDSVSMPMMQKVIIVAAIIAVIAIAVYCIVAS